MLRRGHLLCCGWPLVFIILYLSTLVVDARLSDPWRPSNPQPDRSGLRDDGLGHQDPLYIPEGLTEGEYGAGKETQNPAGTMSNCYCFPKSKDLNDLKEIQKTDMIEHACNHFVDAEFGRDNYVHEAVVNTNDGHRLTARYNVDCDACKGPKTLSLDECIRNMTLAVTCPDVAQGGIGLGDCMIFALEFSVPTHVEKRDEDRFGNNSLANGHCANATHQDNPADDPFNCECYPDTTTPFPPGERLIDDMGWITQEK